MNTKKTSILLLILSLLTISCMQLMPKEPPTPTEPPATNTATPSPTASPTSTPTPEPTATPRGFFENSSNNFSLIVPENWEPVSDYDGPGAFFTHKQDYALFFVTSDIDEEATIESSVKDFEEIFETTISILDTDEVELANGVVAERAKVAFDLYEGDTAYPMKAYLTLHTDGLRFHMIFMWTFDFTLYSYQDDLNEIFASYTILQGKVAGGLNTHTRYRPPWLFLLLPRPS